MFAQLPRQATHPRTAARQAGSRLRRIAAVLAAVTCALVASAGAIPAAFASDNMLVPGSGWAVRARTRRAGPAGDGPHGHLRRPGGLASRPDRPRRRSGRRPLHRPAEPDPDRPPTGALTDSLTRPQPGAGLSG